MPRGIIIEIDVVTLLLRLCQCASAYPRWTWVMIAMASALRHEEQWNPALATAHQNFCP